jgi:HAD superfamily hydrolase (TIGR01509 family)
LPSPIQCPRAILFDMDGTLTEPYFDFDAIRAEIGCPGQPILEAIAKMDATRRATAEAILHRHEERAAAESTLNHGCENVLLWVRERKLKTALVTRNRRINVQTVLARHGLVFDTLITREDGKFKPDPHPLLLACERLNIEPADAWMIGDGSYDCAAGNAAGIRTVWISHGREREFADEPWRTVRDLRELLGLLCACEN